MEKEDKTQTFKKLNLEEKQLSDIYCTLEDINIEGGEVYMMKRFLEIRDGDFSNGTIENAIITGGNFNNIVFINCIFTFELEKDFTDNNRIIELGTK